MSEPPDYEPLHDRLRALREELTPRLDELRGLGFDVDGLLADCDRMTALLHGRGEPGFNTQTFFARLTEFTDEFNQVAHLQRQADRIGAVASLPRAAELLMQAAGLMRAHGGAGELRTAAELEAQAAEVRERVERGEAPTDEIDNGSLALTAQLAELNRRNLFRTASVALYWEKQTPEWWARLSPEARANAESLLEKWRAQREDILSELPLEDRRRLEAMTLEDFERPGACDP